MSALRDAGVDVAETPGEVADLIEEVL
jgi:succinyl-CoA synthetase alpha subunit